MSIIFPSGVPLVTPALNDNILVSDTSNSDAIGYSTVQSLRDGFEDYFDTVYSTTSSSGDMLKSENLAGLTDYAVARENLGIGTLDPTISATAPTSPTYRQYWVDGTSLYTWNSTAWATIADLDSYATFAGFPVTGVDGTIYYDQATGRVFVWDGDEYVPYGTVLPTQDEQITTVVDQTARLALTAVVNDFAVQTDNNLLYQLRSLPASTDTNWSIISPSTSGGYTQVADETARLALPGLAVNDIIYQQDTYTFYVLTALPSSTSGNWQAIGSTSTSVPTPTAPSSPFQTSGFAQAVSGNPAGASDGSVAYTCGDILLGWTASSGATSYDVYEGATLVSNTTATTYTVVSPTTGSHTYTIYAKIGPSYSSGFDIGPITQTACAFSFAYVTNYSGSTLQKINLTTFTSVGTVATGPNPYGVAFDSGFAYVTNYGSNTLQKINLTTFTSVGTVATGTNPTGVAIDSGFAYVANYGSSTLQKINLTTFTSVGTVATGSNPTEVAIDSGFAYVTNLVSNTLQKINLTTFTSVGTVATGSNPYGVAIDSGFAYVANYISSTLQKINLTTFTSVGTVATGSNPRNIAFA